MKIVLFGQPFLDTSSPFMLGEKKIGAINGLLIITEKERRELTEICKKIWKTLIYICPDFTGLIRYDLVPSFSSIPKKIEWEGKKGYDLGNIEITGIYEINDRSPECHTAVSVLHNAKPILKKLQPIATERFVKAVKETYGNEEIIIVKGNGFVKTQWGEIFFRELSESGLKFSVVTETKFIKEGLIGKEKAVYLYGDYRNTRGPSEFSYEFMEHIKNYPRNLVFNTIPSNGFISDKSLLSNIELAGKVIVLDTEEKVSFGLREKDKWVLKRFLGSSGADVYIGRLMTHKDWENNLRKALLRGGYGLFEAKWLPKIKLPFDSYALDINVAFWARGRDLKYLYTISRIDKWKTYWNRGVINVTQGAGFAGTLIEEE